MIVVMVNPSAEAKQAIIEQAHALAGEFAYDLPPAGSEYVP